jgi:hypothetical protein
MGESRGMGSRGETVGRGAERKARSSSLAVCIGDYPKEAKGGLYEGSTRATITSAQTCHSVYPRLNLPLSSILDTLGSHLVQTACGGQQRRSSGHRGRVGGSDRAKERYRGRCGGAKGRVHHCQHSDSDPNQTPAPLRLRPPPQAAPRTFAPPSHPPMTQ